MSVPRASFASVLLALACNNGRASVTTTGDTDTTTATTGTTSTTGITGTTGASTTSGSGATSSSTTAGSTTDPGTTSFSTSGDDTTTGPLTRCPTVAEPVEAAVLDDPDIPEASGLIASRTQPDVFWVHNDSGDDPRFFAVDGAGVRLGVFNVVGADASDWEDMSSGPGPDPGEWLYFADIGDNGAARETVTVYRVPEPDAASANGGELDVAGVEAIELAYPDEPHDAETLLVDPQTGDLVIVAKTSPTRIFRLPAPLAAGGPYALEEVVPIDFPAEIATGGDISPAGDFIAVRTYSEALLWLRPPGASIAEAFAGQPCTIPLAIEVQGETLAVARDSSGYYTVSEGSSVPLWWYAFE